MISVVIPFYNAKETIFKTLDSLREQDTTFEIILVDDASTDHTFEIIRTKHPNIKIIRNKSNLGRAKSRNIGLEISRHNNIFFLDSDVYLEKNSLKQLLSAINSYDIVYPKIIYPNGHAKHPLRENNNFYPLDSAAFLIKKDSCIKNNIKFDSSFKYLEDQDFFIQCSLNGLTAKYLNNIHVIHQIPTRKFSNSKKYFEEISDISFGLKKYKEKSKIILFKHHFRKINLFKGFIAALFNYNYFCYPQDISNFKRLILLLGKHKKFERNRYILLKLFFEAMRSN